MYKTEGTKYLWSLKYFDKVLATILKNIQYEHIKLYKHFRLNSPVKVSKNGWEHNESTRNNLVVSTKLQGII